MKYLSYILAMIFGFTLLTGGIVLAEGVKKGDPVRGKQLFLGKILGGKGKKAKCVKCHGKKGDGKGPGAEDLDKEPRDFTDTTSEKSITRKTDEELFKVISEGIKKTPMKGWKKKLTEQDIWDILSYERTFAKKK